VPTENRPFDGVSADVKDGEHTVWISFGSVPADHLTHGIPNATILRVAPPVKGIGAALEVEAQDGTRTVLELTTPEAYALPGDVKARTQVAVRGQLPFWPRRLADLPDFSCVGLRKRTAGIPTSCDTAIGSA